MVTSRDLQAQFYIAARLAGIARESDIAIALRAVLNRHFLSAEPPMRTRVRIRERREIRMSEPGRERLAPEVRKDFGYSEIEQCLWILRDALPDFRDMPPRWKPQTAKLMFDAEQTLAAKLTVFVTDRNRFGAWMTGQLRLPNTPAGDEREFLESLLSGSPSNLTPRGLPWIRAESGIIRIGLGETVAGIPADGGERSDSVSFALVHQSIRASRQPAVCKVRIADSADVITLARKIQPDALHDWPAARARLGGAVDLAEAALAREEDADLVVTKFVQDVEAETGINVLASALLGRDTKRWIAAHSTPRHYLVELIERAVARRFPYCAGVIDIPTDVRFGSRIRITGRRRAGKTSAAYEAVNRLTREHPAVIFLPDIPVDESLLGQMITSAREGGAQRFIVVLDDIDPGALSAAVPILNRLHQRVPGAITIIVSHETPTKAEDVTRMDAIFRGFDRIQVDATIFAWEPFIDWVAEIVGADLTPELIEKYVRLFVAADIRPQEAIRTIARYRLSGISSAVDSAETWEFRLAELATGERHNERVVLQALGAASTLLGGAYELVEIPDAIIFPFLRSRGLDGTGVTAALHALAMTGWIGRGENTTSLLTEPQRTLVERHNMEGWVTNAFLTAFLQFVCDAKELPAVVCEEMLRNALWIWEMSPEGTDDQQHDAYRSMHARMTEALGGAHCRRRAPRIDRRALAAARAAQQNGFSRAEGTTLDNPPVAR